MDVVPIKLKRYEGCKLQTYDSFNQALDEFYLRVTVAERAVNHLEVDKIKKEAERLKRIVADQEKSIHEDEAKLNVTNSSATPSTHILMNSKLSKKTSLKPTIRDTTGTQSSQQLWLQKKAGKCRRPTLKGSTAKTLH